MKLFLLNILLALLWGAVNASFAVPVLLAGFVLGYLVRLRATPGIIAVPLDAETDTEITILANLISLTPGTLSLLVSPDRRTLYVHAMYLDEGPDALRADLKQQMERRVLELLRSAEASSHTHVTAS